MPLFDGVDGYDANGFGDTGNVTISDALNNVDGYNPNGFDTSTGTSSGGGTDITSDGSGGFNLGDLSRLFSGTNLGRLLSSAYGAAGNAATASDQRRIAEDLLNNADPYRDYRQRAEIPFMLSQILQYGRGQSRANTVLDYTMNRAAAQNPTIQNLTERLTGSDPTGGDYRFYQDQLRDSYTDPLGVYNSPAYQGIADLFKQQIERRDAAAGRNSQYGTRAVEMQGNFLNYLDKYRQGLNSSAGTAGQIQGNNFNSLINGITNMGQVDNQAIGTLAGLYGNINTGLSHLTSTISPRGTAGSGAADAAAISNRAAVNSNYGLTPLMTNFGS